MTALQCWKRFIGSAVLVPVAICGAALAEPPAASAPASRPGVEDVPGDTVLVRLGDADKITQHDFERYGFGATPARYNTLMLGLVQDRSMLLYLKDHPGMVTDEDVEKTIDAAVKPGRTKKQLLDQIAKGSVTLDEIKQKNRVNLGVSALIRVGEKQGADEAYRKAAYEKEPEAYNGTQVRIREIMVPVASYETPAQQEKKRKELEDIRARLAAGQIDWVKAVEESKTPLAAADGERGWISRHGGNEPVAAAAFQMKPNEISPVIESLLGYHIIQVQERHQGNRPVDHPDTIRDLKISLQQQRVYEAMVEIQKKYPVIGVRPPARTSFMASKEIVRPPRMDFGSAPPASRPASRPAKK